MKIDSGESLLYSYLRHVKSCFIVQTNWKPSGNWIIDPGVLKRVQGDYERIQQHKAFLEVFKTNFKQTIRQAEVDVLGEDPDGTIYAVNVAFNELGINYGSKTDTRNRVVKNLLRAHLALQCYFPDRRHVLMFCSPKVSAAAEEIILNYFRILEKDFETAGTKFLYVGNNDFRDLILMETIERIHDEFDTNELFLRSFKLLTVYAEDASENSSPETHSSPLTGEQEEGDLPALKISATSYSGEGNGIPGIEDAPASEIAPATEYVTSAEQKIPLRESGSGRGEEPLRSASGEILLSSEDSSDSNDKEKVKNEILKVLSRVPKWFSRPEQNNSRILISYMQLLEKSEKITLSDLVAACAGIKNFMGNYAQMINLAEKNHGKVFSGTNDNIELWEPVKEFIKDEYIRYKLAYYKGP